MIFFLCNGGRGGQKMKKKNTLWGKSLLFLFYMFDYFWQYILSVYRGALGEVSDKEWERERERESWEWFGLFNNILSKIKLLLSTNR